MWGGISITIKSTITERAEEGGRRKGTTELRGLMLKTGRKGEVQGGIKEGSYLVCVLPFLGF